MERLRARLAAVPPFTLGFVLVCVLQSAVDRIDPTSGQVERLAGLLLLAFASSGLLVALLREDAAPERPGSALSGLALRAALVGGAVVLLLLLLSGARLNPLADLQFVVSLLLVALLTLPQVYDRTSALDAFLARWAVPVGAAVLLVSLPVTVAKLLALPG